MNEPDNYTRVLEFLMQFKGDGQMHPVEAALPEVGRKELVDILLQLRRRGLIRFQDTSRRIRVAGTPRPNPKNHPVIAQILIEGIEYLKKESGHIPGSNTVNIYGSSTNNNVAVNSNHVAFNNINTDNQLSQALLELIDTIRDDASLSEAEQNERVEAIAEMQIEIQSKGAISKSKYYSYLSRFSDASTVGNLLLQLYDAGKEFFK